jgi:hypothetical protein
VATLMPLIDPIQTSRTMAAMRCSILIRWALRTDILPLSLVPTAGADVLATVEALLRLGGAR